MVQFPQQGGPTQIQCQPTIVQSPRGATPVQIHTQTQVVQGLQQVDPKPILFTSLCDYIILAYQ